MKFQGKLTSWDDARGFGFVKSNTGGERVFVHIKSFRKRSRRPVDGDLITYEQVRDARGKYSAVNVSLVCDSNLKSGARPKPPLVGFLIISLFCGALVYFTYLKLLPLAILYWYAAVSVMTFLVYAYDKSAARSRCWRIPESHLHLLAVVGGWPGAYFAQNTLRHKSIKKAFKSVYWLTVMINMAACYWLLSEQGQRFLETCIKLLSTFSTRVVS